MLASLRVADQGYITFLLSPEIRPHEPLCDWIVIAIVHMIVKQDAWLKGANIKLKSASMPTQSVPNLNIALPSASGHTLPEPYRAVVYRISSCSY